MSGSRRYKIINRRKYYGVRAIDLALDGVRLIRDSLRAGSDRWTILPPSPRRILAVRLAYVGDVILTLPALSALRTRFPKAELTLLTSHAAAQLLRGHPDLDQVIAFDAPWFIGRGARRPDSTLALVRRLRQARFDIGFDFRADLRNILVTLFLPGIPRRISYDSGGGGALLTRAIPWVYWRHKAEFHLDILRGCGIDCRLSPPVIPVTAPMEREARTVMSGWRDPSRRLVAIHPGARGTLKRWPASEFRRVIETLTSEHDVQVVVTGAENEAGLCRAVIAGVDRGAALSLGGRLSLGGLGGTLADCDLLVSNDSMPIHLASAVGTPVLAIFGPSKPRETAPLSPGSQVIAKPFPCRYTCDESRCLYRRQRACLQAITARDALQRITQMLS